MYNVYMRDLSRYYKKVIKLLNSNLSKIVILFLVFGFTFILRAHNYDRTPGVGHLEELMFAWAGIHLIEEGAPVAWTSLDFPEKYTVSRGIISYKGGKPDVSVRMVKPWLEHPPLFELITGGSAHLFGANRHEVIAAAYMRAPMIFIAALTSLMIFLIARLISGYWVGILSMLVYGTVPIMVFASRMAVPENLIALFFAVMVYLGIKFYKNPSPKYLIAMPILAGLAGLSKPTGYFLILFPIYVVLLKKWYKSSVLLFVGVIPFILAFFAYGIYYDSELFWRIMSIQSSRPVGFASLGWFFISPAYDIFETIDSWFIFALLSSAFFLFAPFKDERKFITLAFMFAVGVVMISGGETDLLPWYRFPAYPMMAILTAWGLVYLVKESNIYTTFIAAGMLLGNRMLVSNAFRPNVYPWEYRYALGGLMLPAVINTIFNKKMLTSISKFFIIGIIIVGMYLNSKYIYNQFELQCQSKTCEFTEPTRLSTLHFPILWRLLDLGESKYK